MNVLLSITHWGVGGAQTFAIRLAEGLLERGHRIFLHEVEPQTREATDGAGLLDRLPARAKRVAVPPRLLRLGASVDARLARLGVPWRARVALHAGYLRAVVHRERIDVVNSHLFDSDDLVVRALRDTEVPIVLSDHGDYRYVGARGHATRARVAAIFQRANAVAWPSSVSSQALARQARRSGLVEATIPYGIPRPRPAVPPEQVRRSLDIPGSAFVFGMTARGIPEKGWSEALQAFAEVRTRAARELHLVLVGSGEHLSALQAALDPALRRFVHFTGHASDPERWIESFDVALLPSHFAGESLPNAIIEALAHGKPVVATDIGGISEMIEIGHERAGILVDFDATGRADVRALTDAMLRYVTDPDLRAKHASLALEVAPRFDLSTCVTRYEEIFAAVVGRGSDH